MVHTCTEKHTLGRVRIGACTFVHTHACALYNNTCTCTLSICVYAMLLRPLWKDNENDVRAYPSYGQWRCPDKGGLIALTIVLFAWGCQCIFFIWLSGKWSAFRSWLPGQYGYGRLKFLNATHAQWSQRYDIVNLAEDTVIIEQQSHGPFNGR